MNLGWMLGVKMLRVVAVVAHQPLRPQRIAVLGEGVAAGAGAGAGALLLMLLAVVQAVGVVVATRAMLSRRAKEGK